MRDDERFEREVLSLLGLSYRAALSMTGHPDDAEALVLDAFERAYLSFPDVPPDADLNCWMRRILTAAYFDAGLPRHGVELPDRTATPAHVGQDTVDIAAPGITVTTDVHKELQPC
ncbi:hypothetical protein [Streptomyces sp. MI02-7b]|uniref:RNA polymerase sigma factor n=1 Tax=Streptomyces sp. MI02-7b TaxID=462941 RepID=UPI0029A03590|nr:hypothetical protein [Streptomyces sp. MI02-7b]MDX3077822.1 hypothetical protein [Streptomyces sp. MI02-7b]